MNIEEVQHKLVELFEELDQTRASTHPKFLERLAELNAKAKDDEERVEIQFELSTKRIEDDYQRKMAQNKADLERKLKKNKENLLREIEEAERIAELEFNTSEIGKVNNCAVDTNNKKTLRGRGGVLVEPPTYFNATPKPSTPSLTPSTTFLLSDAAIAADVRAISASLNQGSPNKARRLFDVSLSKQRLLYDGKAYKQGEEVNVENREYGKFPARMDIIGDAVVAFKALLPWDTRQIHASCADLVEGRVQVAKKRNN